MVYSETNKEVEIKNFKKEGLKMGIWKPHTSRHATYTKAPAVTVAKGSTMLMFNKSAQKLLSDNFVIIQYNDDNPKGKDIEFIPVARGQENSECYGVSKGRVNCKGFPQFVGLVPGETYELLEYDSKLILIRK